MTENAKEKALEWLDSNGIAYEIMEHKAVFTVEEMDEAGVSAKGGVCKNLFLRDAKGKRHFLVVAPETKRVDLASVAEQLGSTKLSFASPERLEKYLGVSQGSVSPMGVLNDPEHTVTLAFDQDLRTGGPIGVHPNDNTATVWVAFEALRKGLSALGNPVTYIKLK